MFFTAARKPAPAAPAPAAALAPAVPAAPDEQPLDQVALAYAPMIDRQRQISALRLTVFVARPERPPASSALLELLCQAWPAEAGRLSLNLASEPLLLHALGADWPLHLMLEVPAFLAADPAHAEALKAQHQRGATLLLQGLPRVPVPRELLGCFAYSIIDLADERRDGVPPPGGMARQIPHVQSGVRSLQAQADAYGRGAMATLGWPVDDIVAPEPGQEKAIKPGVAAAVELLRRVDREEPLERLEAVVKTDPTLAYKLLKYINSPVFGLRVEVATFGHALMLLGYQRLKRWLALLLVSGSPDAAQRPLACAALRRGLLMEELGASCGLDEGMRGELFICGVFSLLDRMLQQPFTQLLDSVPTSPPVRQALADDAGPFAPYLALARATEAGLALDIRTCAEALLLSQQQVNRALLKALVVARQLE